MTPEEWRAKLTNTRNDLTAEIRNLQRQINRAKEKQHLLRAERHNINRSLSEGRTLKQRSGMTDEWWVATADFAEYIRRWVNAYNEEHDGGGYLTLSMMSTVSTRTIGKVCKELSEFVTYTTAELLLIEVGADHVLSGIKLHKALRGRKLANPQEPPESVYYEE